MTSDALIEIKSGWEQFQNQFSIKEKNRNAFFLVWGGSKYSGVLCMALSSLFYSFMGLFVKILSVRKFPSLEIVFARSLVISMASGMMLLQMRHPFLGSRRSQHLVIARGLIGFISLSAFFYSIQLLPLRDAIVLNFTMPVFTSIFAFIFLKEKWGWKEMIGTILGFIGMIFVIQPSILFSQKILVSDNFLNFKGLFYSLIASSTGAVSYILLRAVGKMGEPTWVCMFSFSAFSTPLSFMGCFFQTFKFPDFLEFIFLICVAVTALLAQIFLTRSFQLEKASKATSIQYIKVIVTYALGILFLNEVPSFFGIFGTLLVISSAFCITYVR